MALDTRLERFDSQAMALHNKLRRRRQAWQGQCAGQPVSLLWGGALAPEQAGAQVLLGLGDDAVAKLHLPVAVLAALGLPAVLDTRALPGALLLELALLSLIEPLEQLTGQPLRVLDRTDPACAALAGQTFGSPLALQAGFAGGNATLSLQLNAPAAGRVVQWLEQHAAPAQHALHALNLALAVQAGEAALNLGELRSLGIGDVLMLDPWPAAQLRVVLGQHWQAWASRTDSTLKLLEAPKSLHTLKENAVSETSAINAPLDGQAPDSTLDQLPLTVVCQLGSVELSLAQLRELGEGSLLSFAGQQEHVDLLVNGRRIGQGQLVMIGDGLGVRLLSLAAS